MVLNAPLTVRVSDGTTDRLVTQYASDLSFTKVAPGGHQSMRVRLNLPRTEFGDLGPQDRCWVYDGRNARTVFGAAYLENPTPEDGRAGQRYDLSAMGGMVLASDESRPLIYVDTSTERWAKDPLSHPQATFETGTFGDMDGAPGRLRVQFTNGATVGFTQFVGAEYLALRDAGTTLGALTLYCESGKTSGDWTIAVQSTPGGVSFYPPFGIGISTIGDTDTYIESAVDYLSLELMRTNAATNVADDDTWSDFKVCVMGQRLDRRGGLIDHGTVDTVSVLASEVVEDLLGRVLHSCDPAVSTIAATSFAIDQLAFPEGVKAETVLTGLAEFEPDYWWGIHESGADDRHRFTYQPWTAEPRYLLSVQDGWRQTGSDGDLCNRVVVYWTDPAGARQSTTVTAADLGLSGIGLPVDALGSRVKDADPITLPAGKGSAANALQIGAAVLRDKINPPLSGSLTVRREVVDLWTGGKVAPWELEPGCPVLVREPGYQIRCTAMTYDDSSVSAALTLGRPVLTESQRIARLARVA